MGTITISVDFLKSLFNIVLCGKPVIDVDVEGVSFEDKQSEEFAEIIAIKLLTGGSVIVWDLNAKAESFEERLNGKAVDFRKENGSIAYKITIEHFKQQLITYEGSRAYLFFYDGGKVTDEYYAYELLQIVVFNEKVYCQ